MTILTQPPVTNAYVRYITGRRDVDWVVVERLIAGITVASSQAERVEAITQMTRRGMSAAEIAARMDCSTRTIVRHRGVTR